MEYDCLAEKLWLLVIELGLNTAELGLSQMRQKMLLVAAISDLRAAYCSFCNKQLVRKEAGQIDATIFGTDHLNNKMYQCNICAELNSGICIK